MDLIRRVLALVLVSASVASAQSITLPLGPTTVIGAVNLNGVTITLGGRVPVDGSGVTQPVSGTVTANAGSNLNTSALALETGGNLATVNTNTAPLLVSGAGGYVRQDSTATIAKESGGNLATVVTNTGNIDTDVKGTQPRNITQFGGNAIATGTGAGGSGIPRVTISNDSALAANQSVNLSQVNGVTTTTGNGAGTTGTLRVSPATDSAISTATGSLNGLNATISTAVATGSSGCGVNVLAGTLAATMTAQQSPDNSTWASIAMVNHNTLVQAATQVFTNPNGATRLSLQMSNSSLYVRVILTSYTSGAATAYINCTPIVNPFIADLSAGVLGSANQGVGQTANGVDGSSNNQAHQMRNAIPATTDYGIVVRPLQDPTTGANEALSSGAKATVTASVNVKASAGNVYGFSVLNGAGSGCWMEIIDSAGAGTLGTGVVANIALPTSGTLNYPPGPFAIANTASGIAVGVASAIGGGSACGSAATGITLFYK